MQCSLNWMSHWVLFRQTHYGITLMPFFSLWFPWHIIPKPLNPNSLEKKKLRFCYDLLPQIISYLTVSVRMLCNPYQAKLIACFIIHERYVMCPSTTAVAPSPFDSCYDTKALLRPVVRKSGGRGVTGMKVRRKGDRKWWRYDWDGVCETVSILLKKMFNNNNLSSPWWNLTLLLRIVIWTNLFTAFCR